MTNTIPPTLNHVIGQGQSVRKLKIALEASFQDGAAFPNLLLSSGPGLGKTTIAKTVACEMASEFIETIGQAISSVQILNGLLFSPVNPNFILFIDESQTLPVEVQTELLKILEEGCIFLANDQKNTVQRFDILPFTLILASTDVNKILPPLRDRMKIICQLRRYSKQDIQLILSQKITQYGWKVEDGVLEHVAQRSFGNPRLSIRMLESIRRTARSMGEEKLSCAHALETFCIEEIDEVGLGPDEREYLSVLYRSTKPMRLHDIGACMGQQPLVISQVIEKTLLSISFLQRTDKGRILTPHGLEHVQSQRSVPNDQARDGGQL